MDTGRFQGKTYREEDAMTWKKKDRKKAHTATGRNSQRDLTDLPASPAGRYKVRLDSEGGRIVEVSSLASARILEQSEKLLAAGRRRTDSRPRTSAQ
jgi:hypothetical protein